MWRQEDIDYFFDLINDKKLLVEFLKTSTPSEEQDTHSSDTPNIEEMRHTVRLLDMGINVLFNQIYKVSLIVIIEGGLPTVIYVCGASLVWGSTTMQRRPTRGSSQTRYPTSSRVHTEIQYTPINNYHF